MMRLLFVFVFLSIVPFNNLAQGPDYYDQVFSVEETIYDKDKDLLLYKFDKSPFYGILNVYDVFQEKDSTGNVVKTDTIKTVQKWTEGKKTGVWITYDNNGGVLESQSYILGEKNGLHKEIDGDYIEEFGVLNDLKNGVFKSYDQNGLISELGYYINDFRVGPWRTYNNGKLIQETTYLGYNEPFQDFTYVNDFKSKRTKRLLGYNEQFEDFTYLIHYKNSEIKKISKILLKEIDEELVSKRITYYENGNIEKEEHFSYCNQISKKYKNDDWDNKFRENGYQYEYFENGNLHTLTSYKCGLKDGVYKKFDEDGWLSESGYYKEDDRHGLWFDYYLDEEWSSITKTVYFNGKKVVEIKN